MSAADKLLIIAPEFDGADPAVVSGAIEIAESQIGPKHCNRELAIAYLAAHMLTISGRGGAGGSITSEKEGDLSRSFGQYAGDDPLGATSYGQELMRLRRQCIFLPRNRTI